MFPVSWGPKITRRTLGRVADFCPICRGFRAFRLTRVGKANPISSLAGGAGMLLGYEKTCATCGITSAAYARLYVQASAERGDELPELIEKTNPDLARKCAARLHLEKRVRESRLSAAERLALIREPFLLTNALIEARAAITRFDPPSGLSLLATVALVIAGMLLAPAGSYLRAGSLGIGCLGVLFTFYLFVTDVGRYTRREVHPKLLIALRPLGPTLQELQDVLRNLRNLGMAAGYKIKPRCLYKDLVHSRETEKLTSPQPV